MRAVVNAVAISDHDGDLPIHFNESQSGASHYDPAAKVRCPCITLDSYAADNAIERIDLLKIDVEGHEMAALRGAAGLLSEGRVDAIYFEYFERYLSPYHPPKDLLEYLRGFGFEICLCRGHDLDKSGGATHILNGASGRSLPVRPISSNEVPSQTDLLAVKPVRLQLA